MKNYPTPLAFAASILISLPLVARESHDAPGKNSTSSSSTIQQMVNAVSRDSLVAYITALQSFGSRQEGTPQRDSAADLITAKLSSWGIPAQSDWYTYSQLVINDVCAFGADSMCLVGSGRTILVKTYGGLWVKVPSPSTYDYSAVDFPTSRAGWVVGSGGSIAHSTDAGASWTAQNSGVAVWLRDVAFANERLGIAVGSQGTILRTTNGGTTWSSIPTGVIYPLYRARVLDSLNMWAVGHLGTILHSSNGGATWNTQVSGTDNSLRGVEFITPRLGWAVGLNLTILKTTDGGFSWNPQAVPQGNAPSSSSMYGVCFPDSNHGWIVDLAGGVRSTSDGGQTWKRDQIVGLGFTNLTSIAHHGPGFLAATGSRGAILTSTDQGATWADETGRLPLEYLSRSRNIVVTIPGVGTPDKECIMLAHYDSGDCPGADDNASGTAAVLEAARILKNCRFQSTIRLLAVSGEELWMVGSGDYALRAMQAGRNVVAAINGDMLGYPLTGDTTRLAVSSYLVRNSLVDLAILCNQRYGIGAKLDAFTDSTGASDYGTFALAGYDALEVAEGTPDEIWGGLNPYYHQSGDTVDKLNPGLMRRAAQLMLATISELAQPVADAVTTDHPTAVPAGFALRQNYPNPFNPATTLRYELPESRLVNLTVYDMLGREVSVLVNERKDAGFHEAVFNGTGLASGVYFARITAGSFVQTCKLILAR